jgi:hypothetical protein
MIKNRYIKFFESAEKEINNLINKCSKLNIDLVIIPTNLKGIDGFYIQLISIPTELQNQGIGTKIFNELINISDKYNKKLILTPIKIKDTDFSKLLNFYKKLGFKKDKINVQFRGIKGDSWSKNPDTY